MSFLYLLRFELLMALRGGRNILQAILFFAFIPVIFHFSLGESLDQNAASGAVWAGLLLAQLLAADAMFRDDVRDGTLDQYILLPDGVLPVVLMKCVAAWLTVSLPMIVLAPMLALMMGGEHLARLSLTLLIATPAITALSAAGAALTAFQSRRGGLMLLICLPLMIPILIFALGALRGDGTAGSSMSLLIGASLFTFPLGIAAATLTLRYSE